MDISVSQGKNTVTIFLKGELDECAADFAREQIDAAVSHSSIKSVVFDLSQLSFMDSTGIGVLIGRYKRMKNRNVVAFVKNPSPSVDKIFKMSGLYQIIPKVV